MARIFDLEETVALLSNFKVVGNKLVANHSAVTAWETTGLNEFKKLYHFVCDIPHVKALYEKDPSLDLLPHHYAAILKKFRTVVKELVYKRPQLFFNSLDGGMIQKSISLVKVEPNSLKDLDRIFKLTFDTGAEEKALVCESRVVEAMYPLSVRSFREGSLHCARHRPSSRWL